jgi:hypothetical protein
MSVPGGLPGLMQTVFSITHAAGSAAVGAGNVTLLLIFSFFFEFYMVK